MCKKVQAKMEYLLRRSVASGSEAPTMLVGKEALAKIVEDAEKTVKDGKAIDISDLQVLDCFSWLFTKEQAAQHSSWVKASFNSSAAAASSSASSEAKETKAVAGVRKKKLADDLASSTMALFKRRKSS